MRTHYLRRIRYSDADVSQRVSNAFGGISAKRFKTTFYSTFNNKFQPTKIDNYVRQFFFFV